MTERPILFSSSMVRAILDGRKTQTRRVVKLAVPADADDVFFWRAPDEVAGRKAPEGLWARKHDEDGWLRFLGPCPYGARGDLLWVRETWSAPPTYDKVKPSLLAENTPIRYAADGFVDEDGRIVTGRLRPSIFMRRWMARLWLEVTGVRVERLQDISEEDAKAEGVAEVPFRPDDGFPVSLGYMAGPDDGKAPLKTTAKAAFADIWRSTYGADSWDANPWVWVVEFKRVERAKEAA